MVLVTVAGKNGDVVEVGGDALKIANEVGKGPCCRAASREVNLLTSREPRHQTGLHGEQAIPQFARRRLPSCTHIVLAPIYTHKDAAK